MRVPPAPPRIPPPIMAEGGASSPPAAVETASHVNKLTNEACFPRISDFLSLLKREKYKSGRLYKLDCDEARDFIETVRSHNPPTCIALMKSISDILGVHFDIKLKGVTDIELKEWVDKGYIPRDYRGKPQKTIKLAKFVGAKSVPEDEENLNPQSKEIENLSKIETNKSLSYAELAARKQILFTTRTQEIYSAKSDHRTEFVISDEEMAALGEVLSRVPDDIWEKEKEKVLRYTKENIYYWGIVNSSIIFPYLKLDEAAKNVKSLTRSVHSWGWKDKEVHLPRRETIKEDSTLWGLIIFILERNIGEDKIFYDVDTFDSSFPMLDNETTQRKPKILLILKRIIELFKSPATATIRTVDLSKAEVHIKNVVDGYVLDQIRRRSRKYDNHELSGICNSQVRRTKKITKTVTVGGRQNTVTIDTYVGYKLCEFLAEYTEESNKEYEYTGFSKFITTLLDLIVEINLKDESYTLPRIFFQTPSEQVRLGIRKGPKIKAKDGKEKCNNYIPFSFVKSSECTEYPIVTKKKLTDIGTAVIRNLDSVNKMSLIESNDFIPALKGYMEASYYFSDDMRREWRSKAIVPDDPSYIKTLLCDQFNLFFTEDGRPCNCGDTTFAEYVEDLKAASDRIRYQAVGTPEYTRCLLERIKGVTEKRKADRLKESRRPVR